MVTLRRLLPIAKVVFVCTVFVLAVRALHSVLAGYRWQQLTAYLHTLPSEQIAAAALLALICYFVTTGYDAVAFQHIEHGLPYGRIALAAFTAYAINNNLGMSGVVGSSLRYRFYRRWGLTPAEIVTVFVFCTVTFYLGFLFLGGLVFLLWPPVTAQSFHLGFTSLRLLGIGFLLPAVAYSAWILIQRAPMRLRRWKIDLPKRSIFVAQLIISIGDWLIAGAVLNIVLPTTHSVPFVTILGTFFMAQVAGLVSNVPGGLGVFEAVVLVSLKPYLSPIVILGALVTFRAVFFLLPLALALLLLGGHELSIRIRAQRPRRAPRLQWRVGMIPDGCRALVIEDDVVISSLFQKILQREHFTVDSVRSGTQALERIGADRYHLLVLDLMLPQTHGWQVVEYLRAHHLDMLRSIIIVSADASAIRGEYPEPICRFLAKPFDIEEFARLAHECKDACTT